MGNGGTKKKADAAAKVTAASVATTVAAKAAEVSAAEITRIKIAAETKESEDAKMVNDAKVKAAADLEAAAQRKRDKEIAEEKERTDKADRAHALVLKNNAAAEAVKQRAHAKEMKRLANIADETQRKALKDKLDAQQKRDTEKAQADKLLEQQREKFKADKLAASRAYEAKCEEEKLAAEAQKLKAKRKYDAECAERAKSLEIQRAELKRLEIEANKPKPHRVWVGERRRLKIAIAEYKACRDNTGLALRNAQTNISDQEGLIAKYKIKLKSVQLLVTNFNKAKLLQKETLEYDLRKAAYDECKNEIDAMIEKTCVNRDHMSNFLKLTQNIVPTVLKGVKQASELDAHFKTFYEIIERQCSEKLTIDHYFATESLSRFVPTLVMQDMLVMQDLECEDKEEFEEEILGILQSAVKETQSQWEDDKKTDDQAEQPELAKRISRTEKNKLRNICYKDPTEWKDAQIEKAMVTKLELSKLAPGMVTFFERLDDSLVKALKLLEFGSELNTAQQEAVKMKALEAPKSQPTIKEVPNDTVNSNSNSAAQNDDDFKQTVPGVDNNSNSNSDKYNSSKPIVEHPANVTATVTVTTDTSTAGDSTAEEKEKEENEHENEEEGNTGDAESNNNDSNSANNSDMKTDSGDMPLAEYVAPEIDVEPVEILVSDFIIATQQNNNFCEVALRSIDVVSTMEEELVKSNGKNFASAIQHTCEKIVESQSNLRRNIAFAMEIAKLKPAHLTEKAQTTWQTIDESCIQIYKSAIAVWEVSAEYFSFFSRFRQAFGRYISCMEMKSDCKFVVSLEFLKRDIRDFLKFKNKYNKVMMSLNQEAIGCISKCVTQISGSASYDSATKNFDKAQQAYFTQISILKSADVAADKNYCLLKEEESICAAELTKAKYLLETYKDMVQNMNQNNAKGNCEVAIAKLQKQLETAVDFQTQYK